MSIGATVTKPPVAARVAVDRFLKHMGIAARRTFPAWSKTLTEGLNECPLTFDLRYALLEAHPLDDYYFAGVVALEASKIRRLFAPDEASELLSLIAEQIDGAAGRKDRIVSDLAFSIVGRVEAAAHIDKQKMPHDQVVKAILQKLGVDRAEASKHLIHAVLYRHTLGEPLALDVPQWWQLFRAKYTLSREPEASQISQPGSSKGPSSRVGALI